MPTFGQKYDRDTDETQDALEAVIGKEIKSVRVSGDALSIVVDDGTKIEILDDGQCCCEDRHMSCDDDLSSYIGATILRFELADGTDVADDSVVGGVHNTQFLRVHTSKDLFTVVNHNEHNGYYGGFSIVAAIVGG